MAGIYYFSGTIAILLQVLYGPVLSIECITCEWSAGEESKIDCVSAPYTENFTDCGKAEGNFAYSCETRIQFQEERSNYYLSKVTRRCELEHGDCNRRCDPRLRRDCYICCTAENNCNSIPLSIGFLPRHLVYNVTNHATTNTLRHGSHLFQLYVLLVSIVSWCFVLWL